MKKKRMAATLLFFSALLLVGCFPDEENNYSTRNREKMDKISIEECSSIQEHLSREPFVSSTADTNVTITVDADVNVQVGNNFDVYKAKSAVLDFDLWKTLFMGEKELSVTSEVDDGDHIIEYEDGSAVVRYGSMINQYSYVYFAEEYHTREIEYFYHDGGNNVNGQINYLRDTLFKKQELDFMSSDEACKLVDDKLKKIGMKVEQYHIYTVTYQYIKDRVEHDKQVYGDDDFIDYTPDDAFYIIIPEIRMPNGGLLTEMNYLWAEDGFSDIISATVYGIVGKNGILKLECSGWFELTGEKNEVKEIVSVDSALDTMLNEYKMIEVKEPLAYDIHKIELAYIPYLTDVENSCYELKPTWLFYMVRETEVGETTQSIKAVDAVIGTRLLFGGEI